MARFRVGDRVMIHKPGHAEHGAYGVVSEVIPIAEYGGPAYRGPHAYRCENGWQWRDGRCRPFGGALPDAMVVAHTEK